MTDNLINLNYYNQITAADNKSVDTGKSVVSNFSNLLQNAVSAIDKKQSGSSSMNDIFERAASQYDVPVNLLKAVAKNESNFDSNAVSSCGAQGVMQLMPSTAKSLGVQDSLDPEQNIMGGAKYISQMLSRYDGDTKLALAAYNAGSGNVAKYGGIPPFKETQTYVARVMKDAGADLTTETSQLPSLTSVLGSSLASNFGTSQTSDFGSSLTSLLGSSQTSNLSSSLSSLLDSSLSSSSSSGATASSLGGSSYTYDDYISFLQMYIAQMQSKSMQAMSSDLTGLLSSDTSATLI